MNAWRIGVSFLLIGLFVAALAALATFIRFLEGQGTLAIFGVSAIMASPLALYFVLTNGGPPAFARLPDNGGDGT